ncbi:hypothetical protein D030_3770B, partial [Vibrio parahaemolyticus AQ3810]
TASSTDCSQTRYTCTSNQNFRWWHFTCSRNLTGKEATKLMRRFNYRAVTGNVSH